ncbi:hypothetical protein H8959_000062, partial [Pygathrix nigripes]
MGNYRPMLDAGAAVPRLASLSDLCHESSRLEPGAEQQYLDTLKQLSKRINPPHRVVNKIDKNEGPLKTLPKCDNTLEKLKNDMAVVSGMLGTPRGTGAPPRAPGSTAGGSFQQHLCQQLLDAILANIHSPVFSHSLCIHCSHDCHPRPTHHVHAAGLGFVEGSWPALGHMCPVWSPCCLLKAPVVCTQKHRLEDDQRQSTPSVLQGEVARLDPKCVINLDASHCSNSGTVRLICKLGECPGASGWRWLANLDRSPRPLPFEPEGTVHTPPCVHTPAGCLPCLHIHRAQDRLAMSLPPLPEPTHPHLRNTDTALLACGPREVVGRTCGYLSVQGTPGFRFGNLRVRETSRLCHKPHQNLLGCEEFGSGVVRQGRPGLVQSQ